MTLGQSIRNAIGTVWRVALSAASRGQSAARAIGQAIEQIGQEAAPPVLMDTAATEQIASMAGSWVAAEHAFSRAVDNDLIDASMITMAPWSMDLNAYNRNPSYHVIVGINVEGQEEPVFRTLTGITDLPLTAGELRQTSYINSLAMSVGTTPGGGVGGTVTGISSITITVGPPLG